MHILIQLSLLVISMWNDRLGMGVNYCGTCKHYLGCGDWNLCCDLPHPTPGEIEAGIWFNFGHMCYEDTVACDMYEPKDESRRDKK